MGEIVRHSAETDGALDKCSECGERARYVENTDKVPLPWGVECTECANGVFMHASRARAMIVWNQTQRHNRGENCEQKRSQM